MKKLFLSVATAGVLVLGCSKQNLQEPIIADQNAASGVVNGGGGDDDDDPIIMHITRDVNGYPLSGATVMFCDSRDTIRGTSDQDGTFGLRVPQAGNWLVIVGKSGYVTEFNQAVITVSFTTRVDTLISE